MDTNAADIEDFRLHWASFCDRDTFPGADDFEARMEAAGLIEADFVTKDDLDDTFAVERGLEIGGLKWVPTSAGRAVLSGEDVPAPTQLLLQALSRYRQTVGDNQHPGGLTVPRALELLEIAALALDPFKEISKSFPDVAHSTEIVVAGDRDNRRALSILDMHRAADAVELISTVVCAERPPAHHETDAASYWRQECKEMEIAFMSAKGEHSELALAMGFDDLTWFGDPLAPHSEIVEQAKRLYVDSTVGWLYDNEDVGREFSTNHPVESGEVPDATNITPATAPVLLNEMTQAWQMLSEIHKAKRELETELNCRRTSYGILLSVQGFREWLFKQWESESEGIPGEEMSGLVEARFVNLPEDCIVDLFEQFIGHKEKRV